VLLVGAKLEWKDPLATFSYTARPLLSAVKAAIVRQFPKERLAEASVDWLFRLVGAVNTISLFLAAEIINRADTLNAFKADRVLWGFVAFLFVD